MQNEFETEDVNVTTQPQTLKGFENMVVPNMEIEETKPTVETPAPVVLPKERVEQTPSTVDSHGNVTLSKTKNQPLNLPASKPYLFPTHDEDGEKTEYAMDLESIDSGLRMVADGTSPKEVYKGNMKLQAMTYRHLVQTKGADPRKAAKGLGLDYELIQASTDPWERYKSSLSSDVNQVGAGFMRMGKAVNESMGDEHSVKVANEFIANTDKIVQRDKDSQDMYDSFFMEYDEKTGKADSPWNLASMAGSSTIDVASGAFIAKAVKGTTAATRAIREAYLNVAFAFGKEGAKLGYHGDGVEFGTGVMSAMAGEAVGQFLMKRFMPPVNAGIETKPANELQDMLEGLRILKKYDINVGEEDLLNPDAVLTKIKAKSHNSAEVERLAKIYTGRNAELMKGLNKSLHSMGITDAGQLNDYAEGLVPLDKMGPQFKEYIQTQQQIHKDKMDPVYDSLKDLDVNPSTGNASTYKLGTLLESIDSVTHNAKAINSSVKSELGFILNVGESTDSKNIKNVMSGIQENIKTEAKNFLQINADIGKIDDAIMTTSNTLDIAKQRLSELSLNANPSVGMQLEEAVRKSVKALDGLSSQKRSLVAARRESTKTRNRLTQERGDNLSAFKVASDPEYASIIQVNDLRRHLVSLQNGTNNSFMDTQGKTHAAAIKRSIGEIDKWLDNIPTDDGKFLISRLRYANGMARDGFDKWGDGAFKGIDKMLKSDDPNIMNSLFTGDNAMFHIQNLGKLAGKDSELYSKTVAKFLGDKILSGVRGPSGVKNLADVNWEKFTNNVSSPEFRNQVKTLLGADVEKELVGIGYLAKTLGKHIDEAYKHISHTQDQKRHILKTIYGGAAGDAIQSLMAGVERYTGKLVKTKFYGGSSDKGRIKASVDNAIADIVEIVSGKTILGSIPNTRYSTKEAIEEVVKELTRRQGNPNAIIAYIKKMASGGTWRRGSLDFSRGSSRLGGPLGRPNAGFDIRNIDEADKPFLSNLKNGEYVTDKFGNQFQKSSKMDLVEVSRPQGGFVKAGSKNSKTVKRSRPGTVFEIDGNFYRRDKVDKFEPVNNIEGGKYIVDSTNAPGKDLTNPETYEPNMKEFIDMESGAVYKVPSDDPLRMNFYGDTMATIDRRTAPDEYFTGLQESLESSLGMPSDKAHAVANYTKSARGLQKIAKIKRQEQRVLRDKAWKDADVESPNNIERQIEWDIEDDLPFFDANMEFTRLRDGDIGLGNVASRHNINPDSPIVTDIENAYGKWLRSKNIVDSNPKIKELGDELDSINAKAREERYKAKDILESEMHKDMGWSEESIVNYSLVHRDMVDIMEDANLQGTDLYKAMEPFNKELISIKNSETSRVASIRTTKNAGTAQVTSPLDDAIYSLRTTKGKIPNSADEWITYLKNKGVSYDELEGSQVGIKLKQMEDSGIPQTLENVETALNDRADKIYKTPLNNSTFDSYMPHSGQYKKVPGTYNNNIYTSKVGDSVDVYPGKRQAHFDIGTDPDTGGMFGHTRTEEYIPKSGGKGKVIGELQSDVYQNVANTGATAEHQTYLARLASSRDGAVSATTFPARNAIKKIKKAVGDETDMSINDITAKHFDPDSMEDMDFVNSVHEDIGDKVRYLMQRNGYPDNAWDIEEKILKDLFNSPNPNIIKSFQAAGAEWNTPGQAAYVNDEIAYMEAMLYSNVKLPKDTSPDKIPYGEGWFQTMGARELVDAYNEGYSEVAIPIGKFIDGPNSVDSRGKAKWPDHRYEISRVAEDMERGAGPTKWYTQAVEPWLEKVGVQIDAKDISYDETTEMITIKMPNKPFNITVKGTGSVPSKHSGRTKEAIIKNKGKPYRKEI